MAPITYDTEVASSSPPARLFKAFILDDNLICKVLPEAIKSVEILEGDGGAGSVKLITFGEGSQFKSAKHRIDALEKDNFTYSYTIIEGDALKDVIQKVCYVIKIEASADGGSICKIGGTYHTKGDIRLTEEQIEEGKEKIKAGKKKALAMFKAVEGYLLGNSDAYK